MIDGSDMGKNTQKWLIWAQKIQAIAQTGLTFANSEYDIERFNQLQEIAAEIVQDHINIQKTDLINNFNLQKGYATPKIDVRGAVIVDNQILLVQERSDEHWCMPGGWADVGEGPSESVIREIWEESGFETKVSKIIGVFDANRCGRELELYHAFKIVFLCEILGGSARPSNETLAVDFFDFDSLPPLSKNRTNEKHIKIIKQHLMDKSSFTFFE